MRRQVNLNEVLTELEIVEERFHNIMRSPSPQLALERLEDLKRTVRKQKRILAKKYHPDIPGGSTKKMQRINSCVDIILNLRIQIQRPRPVINVRWQTMSATYGSSTTTTTFYQRYA